MIAASRATGSSPLTRGKPFLVVGVRFRRGLIPAHAGKTLIAAAQRDSRRAHPRSRGENLSRLSMLYARAGSSPLTRGKPVPSPDGSERSGLIPAHAGKTRRMLCPDKAARAHPRSRGENPKPPALAGCAWGSSPLTRGKRGLPRKWGAIRGLIPAHAGKTTASNRDPRRDPAHPRSRGENLTVERGSRGLSGSSPLTRGKPASW